jgi:hypothetical protein|tara:strand:- start:5392 stop:6390 length:999 start_codon:yes stop_codon:yes gene_type:complete
MRNFFTTFFSLPKELSAGFLSNDLSSSKLIVFALTCFIQGNWELRALLLTHLASAGAGARLGKAYAHPVLKLIEGTKEDLSSKKNAVEALIRKTPPQEPNFSSFAKDAKTAEQQGMMPGYQGKDWWAVGSVDMTMDDGPVERKRDDDDDDSPGGGVGVGSDALASVANKTVEVLGLVPVVSGNNTNAPSAATLASKTPETSMAYWSDGSAALVVTSAVRRTGLRHDELYGSERRKFAQNNALLNLAFGPKAVPSYLTGEMPGDQGWDPLAMGAQRDIIKLRERELIHGRWAMLAVVGVLVPETTARLGVFGTYFPITTFRRLIAHTRTRRDY